MMLWCPWGALFFTLKKAFNIKNKLSQLAYKVKKGSSIKPTVAELTCQNQYL
jgi:hypothetical protein